MLGRGVFAATLVISAGSLIAQQPHQTTASRKQTPVSVPFVGCRSDRQTGPLEAPSGKDPVLAIGAELALQLAYYSSADGFGVVAPRGWYCFGTYGSGGERLFVLPSPIDTGNIFTDKWSGFLGPAVELAHSYGDTSGRFNVAEIIARVFPAYQAFTAGVMKELSPPDTFSFGPFPKDKLTSKGATVTEYITPAQTDGLGTHSDLRRNASPIQGVAILVERAPDLLLLAVRLPPELAGLTSGIIHQVEHDAESRPQPKSVR
jgi:hypothetical protein